MYENVGDIEKRNLMEYVQKDIDVQDEDIVILIETMNWYDCLLFFDDVVDSLSDYYGISYEVSDYVDYQALAEDSRYVMLSNNLVMWQSLWLDENRYEEFIDEYKEYHDIHDMAKDLEIPCE